MPTAPKADDALLKRAPPRYFTAWSFSRWSDHSDPETGCPRRARLKHLDKLPEPSAPRADGSENALDRGARIHREAEDYVKGLLPKLPASLANFATEFKHLKKVKATAEGKWGLDVKWQPVDFMDWDRCWCRVITDVHWLATKTRAVVVDHKTGRVYGRSEDQLELAAVGGFSRYPAVLEIETQLWYLDQGVILPEDEADRVFTRKEVTQLQKKWRERAIPLLMDKKFVPRPGPHCSRCAYSKAKGGPCEFGG